MTLVQFLYCLLIAYSTREYPIKQLNSVASPSLLKGWFKEIPELKAAFDAYKAGAEIDTDALGTALRDYANNEYVKRENAKQSFKETLLAFAAWFRTESTSALSRLEKISTNAENPFIREFFVKEIGDQNAINNKLKKLVTKLGGNKGDNVLNQKQKDLLKQTNPQALKDYNALRRDYNKVWQDALSSFVRSSGNKIVPYQNVLKFLKAEGYEHTMPSGFTGGIDANGNWYAPDDKPITGKPAATIFPSVVMNPNYGEESGGDWVFVAMRSDGTKGNYFYTVDYKTTRSAEKFSKVKNLIPVMDKVRKKWLSNINNFDEYNKLSVISIVLELLYRSSNRIGTVGGNKKTGAGFGMGTILTKMVKKTQQGYKIQYQGKDNVKTIYLLKRNEDQYSKKVAAALDTLLEGKKPTDVVFTFKIKDGSRKPVLPTAVRDYFKTISGGLSVHKIRTYWGTKLFMDELEAIYKKVKTIHSMKEATELLAKMALIVGTRLNHVRNSVEGTTKVTPKTALDNYIDPGLQMEFFNHYGLPLPKYLEKLLSTPTTADVSEVEDTEDVDSEYDKHALDSDLDTGLLERYLVGDRTATFNTLV